MPTYGEFNVETLKAQLDALSSALINRTLELTTLRRENAVLRKAASKRDLTYEDAFDYVVQVPHEDGTGIATWNLAELLREFNRLKTANHEQGLTIDDLRRKNTALQGELELAKQAAELKTAKTDFTIKRADAGKYTIEVTPEKCEKGWVPIDGGFIVSAEIATAARTMKLDKLIEHVEDLEGRMDEIGTLADLDRETDKE